MIASVATLALTAAAAPAQVPSSVPGSHVFVFAGSMRISSGHVDDEVTVDFDGASSTYSVTDRAGVVGEGRCSPVDAQTVTCGEGQPLSLVSWTGADGDDSLFVRAAAPGRVLAAGGAGNDVVRLEDGSSARAVLAGRYGGDILVGDRPKTR